MKLGAHMSIAEGLHLSIYRGKDIGCQTIQIFTKNATRWKERDILDEEVALFKEAQKATGINPVIAHDSYLINLASPDHILREKSIDAFIHELERAGTLGLSHLATHPGSHRGAGEEEGLTTFSRSLNLVLQETEGNRVKITIETTAGQGSSLGYRFEHIARVLDAAKDGKRCAVCLDTAHIFAAGYDIRGYGKLEEMLNEFNRLIGLERLEVIHVNDSKAELGSRVDRHQHLGEGHLGLKNFRNILHHPALKNLPFILETPLNAGGHRRNLELLRSLSTISEPAL